MPTEHHTRRARTLSDSQQGSDVLWVCNPVEHEDEGEASYASDRDRFAESIEGSFLERRRDGDHALVGPGAGLHVDPSGRHHKHTSAAKRVASLEI